MTSIVRHRYMTPSERFWVCVEKTETCWLWTGARDKDGYGKFRGPRHTTKAHRASYLINVDPEADLTGWDVMHSCDNPPCVNPQHLSLGTSIDNVADRDTKGRSAAGDANGSRLYPERRPRGATWRGDPRVGVTNGRARLDESRVREIRELAAAGLTKRAIGRRYGVTDVLIGKIVRRELWGHVS